jgi:hypothetical protein
MWHPTIRNTCQRAAYHLSLNLLTPFLLAVRRALLCTMHVKVTEELTVGVHRCAAVVQTKRLLQAKENDLAAMQACLVDRDAVTSIAAQRVATIGELTCEKDALVKAKSVILQEALQERAAAAQLKREVQVKEAQVQCLTEQLTAKRGRLEALEAESACAASKRQHLEAEVLVSVYACMCLVPAAWLPAVWGAVQVGCVALAHDWHC